MLNADDARKWAKGFEDGIAPDQHLAVMPVKNLRLLIADLRRFADEHDELLKAALKAKDLFRAAFDANLKTSDFHEMRIATQKDLDAAIAKANGQPAETSPQ